MYINLLYLPLFNFAYLFFHFFLCFPLNIFVSFIFITLSPNWHLALVLFSILCFNQFCSGRYNFWFLLFTRSIYCTLFLLDCFAFAYGCICICVHSVTLSIVVINLCLYIRLLPFCGVFLYSFFFCFFFFFSFLFIIIFNFLNLLYFFYIYSFVCLSYSSFSLAVNL